jgi:hypothetical protein
MEYWVPDVQVGALHELVANALVMEGETRTTDLRQQPFASQEDKEDA